jgi:hypothetical protein
MDTTSLIVIVLVVAFLVWALFRLQRRAVNPPKLQVAMELISIVNENLRLISQKKTDPQNNKKFKVNKWDAYDIHLDFLDKDAVEALKEAFKQMEEYNRAIDASTVTATPPQAFSLDSVLNPLSRGRTGLADWIRANIGKESTRGFFSWR